MLEGAVFALLSLLPLQSIGERRYDDIMGASATLEPKGRQDGTQKDDK